LFRVLASLILVALAIWLVDPSSVLGHLSRTPLWVIAASTGLHIVVTLTGVYRWQGIIGAVGKPVGVGRALANCYAGIFFNQVLPTTFGGDAVRSWLAHKDGQLLADALSGVVLDRIIGFLALALTVTAAAILWGGQFNEPGLQFLLVAALPVTLGATLLLMFAKPPAMLARASARMGLERLSRDMKLVFGKLNLMAWLIFLSVAGHLIAGTGGYLVAVSQGAVITLTEALLIFPAMVLATIVPISFAGWGVREGAAVVLLAGIGVAPDLAIAISITIGATQFLAALPGVLLWHTARNMTRNATPQNNPAT
jgi:uncharacterized membrane protein YbhN (UPF0104 family)